LHFDRRILLPKNNSVVRHWNFEKKLIIAFSYCTVYSRVSRFWRTNYFESEYSRNLTILFKSGENMWTKFLRSLFTWGKDMTFR
jgi:hypothetical protein